jgi:hypothetical protein
MIQEKPLNLRGFIDPSEVNLDIRTKVVIVRRKKLTRSMFTIDEEQVNEDGQTFMSSTTN